MPTLDSIELKDARFTYPKTAGGEGFALGPINLTIRPGEILFITGENGCGKTTLIKLILALYEPTEGNVLLNGEVVSADRRDDYRQLFSAIFFDFFLFDDLVHAGSTLPAEAQTYLEKLEIAHKVTISDGRFSTINLSAGQRKRLALIQVYLENRPVIVFDEWAAEQDPTFRRVFYEEILPDLKRQGKALVVISHDDRFFGVADKRFHLKDGKQVVA
jgi:putative ATP-binding cassette transporter